MGKRPRSDGGMGTGGRIIGLAAISAALGCSGGEGRDSSGLTSATTVSTGVASSSSTGAEPPTTGGTGDGTTEGTSAGTTAITGATTAGPASDGTTDSGSTSEPPGTSTGPGSTTGFTPEYFMMTDPLKGGTTGTALGGSFGDDGWTVTGDADRVYWAVPRLAEGSVEFKVTNITIDNLPLNDHEIFAMYEGGHGIEHPIGYSPDFRTNAYKSMIRIYGQAEVGRTGQQKLMWGMCPLGAGYHDGTCPCQDPVGFFEEPFGGDADWDGSTQTLRVEWKDGMTRYYRNGGEVLSIDWSGTGLQFGPQELYVSLGNPRPEAVDTAAMPIGAVFSDLVVEGWTGPEAPICQ